MSPEETKARDFPGIKHRTPLQTEAFMAVFDCIVGLEAQVELLVIAAERQERLYRVGGTQIAATACLAASSSIPATYRPVTPRRPTACLSSRFQTHVEGLASTSKA